MFIRLCLLVIVVFAAMTTSNAQIVKPDAPTFNLTSIDGKNFNLASLRGKVVVLDFWFTGCEPCLEELPKLNRLVDDFKDKDVVFIAPTWDKEPILQSFLKKHPYKYNIIPDAGEFVLASCMDGEGNVAMPTHLLIDQDGKIETKTYGGFTGQNGEREYNNFRDAIMRLLKASPGKAK